MLCICQAFDTAFSSRERKAMAMQTDYHDYHAHSVPNKSMTMKLMEHLRLQASSLMHYQ
ncbi:hypothetical protein DPMN_092510 [Dreissena polymorpha]|uniref:Uncharacterized protein n=1 Tax=Dreissena polymorpha TaxID=45954 RepID=A0A9D4L2H7_DREPO|nr:hypothetical protein DPMN_092510 [Dreissena polymorpha]